MEEALENQNIEREIKPVYKITSIIIPSKVKNALTSHVELNISFKALSPRKQRE
tara:strand:- start:338 stop:499 length:162 start_codon:yes stop_codon:yes gene_type:complete